MSSWTLRERGGEIDDRDRKRDLDRDVIRCRPRGAVEWSCPAWTDQYCLDNLSQEEQAVIAAAGCAEVTATFCAGG